MFKEITPSEFQENCFTLLNKDWMLISAGDQEQANTMTASWGGFGILWNKPVATIYVRPQRYTYQFLEQQDTFSLSFFPDEMHDVLSYCGTHSGLNEDKIDKCHLTTLYEDTTPYFQEARLVFICRKSYWQDMDPKHFLEEDIDHHYPLQDYHRIYIGEITKILVKP